jgi:AcrR family transcriptional regulator
MRDIAAAVGVSPPALYYHFDNIDAIVDALLRYVVVESAAFATGAASGPDPAPQRLHALVSQHVDRLTSGPHDLWFVAGMSDDVRARFPDVTRHATRWRRAVAAVARDGARDGELRAVDPRLAVAAVSGLVYGALELRHHGGTVDADTVADLAVATLAPRR